MTLERLNDEINQLDSRKDQFIQTDRSKALAAYDDTTRASGVWIVVIIGVMLLFCACTFYVDKFDEWFSNGVNWGILTGCLLLSGFLSLYFPYRKHYRKKLEQELMEQVTNIANQHHKLQEQQDTLHLELHLAGMVIDRLATLQGTLMQRYQSLKSYVGNLSVWYDEESKNCLLYTSPSPRDTR